MSISINEIDKMNERQLNLNKEEIRHSVKEKIVESLELSDKTSGSDKFSINNFIDTKFGLDKTDLVSEIKESGINDFIKDKIEEFREKAPEIVEVVKNTEKQSILREGSESSSDEILKAVVENSNSKDNVLKNIAENSSSSELLQKIAEKSNSYEVLSEIANNKNSSDKTLEIVVDKAVENDFSNLKKNDLLSSVVENPNVSDETLKKVFENTSSHEVLEKIGDSKVYEKEKELEFQDSLKAMKDGMSLQEVYSETPSKEVADLVKDLKNIDFDFNKEIESIKDAKMLISETREEQKYLASSTKNPEILDKLSKADDESVLKAVSNNKNTSEKTLEDMINREDVSLSIKFNIANKTDKPDLLEKISEKNEDLLKIAVSNNFSSSAATLDKLASLESETLKDSLKTNVSDNASTSSETLDKLSNSENKEVLRNVVEHDNVSNDTLIKLAEHSNKEISEASLDKLSERLDEAKEIAQERGLLSEDKAEAKFENKQEDKNEVKNENKVEQGQSM